MKVYIPVHEASQRGGHGEGSIEYLAWQPYGPYMTGGYPPVFATESSCIAWCESQGKYSRWTYKEVEVQP